MPWAKAGGGGGGEECMIDFQRTVGNFSMAALLGVVEN